MAVMATEDLAQTLATTGEARHDGADGNSQRAGDLLIAHFFQRNEQQNGTLRFRQAGQGGIQIVHFQPIGLRRPGWRRTLLIAQRQGIQALAAQLIDAQVVHNAEQPDPQIAA